MSELERLIEIVRALPPAKVHELLTAGEEMTSYVPEDEFLRRINSASAIDVDAETAADLRTALAQRGTTISHEELKQNLGKA